MQRIDEENQRRRDESERADRERNNQVTLAIVTIVAKMFGEKKD
jgi:hypothetical protein